MRFAVIFLFLLSCTTVLSQTRIIKDVVCETIDTADILVRNELFFKAYHESMLNLDECIGKLSEADSLTLKQIPLPISIKDEFVVALALFPDIRDKNLKFKYKKIRGTMNARPDFFNIIRSKSNRKYIVLINNNKGRYKGIPLEDLTPGARLGWYGHEIAHLQSYQMMSNVQMILFTIRYLTSVKYVKKAERFTDFLAIERGLVFQIYESGKYLAKYGNVTKAYKKMNVFNSLTLDEYICLWHMLGFRNFINDECK